MNDILYAHVNHILIYITLFIKTCMYLNYILIYIILFKSDQKLFDSVLIRI